MYPPRLLLFVLVFDIGPDVLPPTLDGGSVWVGCRARYELSVPSKDLGGTNSPLGRVRKGFPPDDWARFMVAMRPCSSLIIERSQISKCEKMWSLERRTVEPTLIRDTS